MPTLDFRQDYCRIKIRLPSPLPQSRIDGFFSMLDDIVSTSVFYSLSVYRSPLEHIEEYYQRHLPELKITWKEFLQCGAFSTCLKHYIMSLYPEELYEICKIEVQDGQKWRHPDEIFEREWWLPEMDRTHLLLNVSVDEQDVMLSPREPDQTGTIREFAEQNRYWYLHSAEKRDLADLMNDLTRNELIDVSSSPGVFKFDKNEVIDELYVDGIDILGEHELPALFTVG